MFVCECVSWYQSYRLNRHRPQTSGTSCLIFLRMWTSRCTGSPGHIWSIAWCGIVALRSKYLTMPISTCGCRTHVNIYGGHISVSEFSTASACPVKLPCHFDGPTLLQVPLTSHRLVWMGYGWRHVCQFGDIASGMGIQWVVSVVNSVTPTYITFNSVVSVKFP
jgi:hypothetical protein